MVTKQSSIIILGIDPGYDRVGWCVGEATGAGQMNVVMYGAIQTSKTASRTARYTQIDQELTELLKQHSIQEAALETLFFSKNQTSAMHVSEARGVILSVLLRHQVKIFEYNPMQVKQAVTGYGKADKAAVERMVRMQAKLTEKKVLDDTIDAIAVALTHAASRQLTTPV